MRLRVGRMALTFGVAALLVALAGLLYVLQTIVNAATVLLEIGANAHG